LPRRQATATARGEGRGATCGPVCGPEELPYPRTASRAVSRRHSPLPTMLDDSQCTPRHDQAACGARESPDGALDFARITHVDRSHLDSERWRDGLDCRPLANSGGYGGVPNDSRPRHARREFFEALTTPPFCSHSVKVVASPRNQFQTSFLTSIEVRP
jgi:hypothetical protein